MISCDSRRSSGNKPAGWSNNGTIMIDFLVVGTAKAGTTSLFQYLRQNPEICLPTKETFFYISELYQDINPEDPAKRNPKEMVFDAEAYRNLMSKCPEGVVRGEVGTGYLYHHETAIPKIREMAGDPKIIMILRNPVERAFSNYMHFIRNDYEKADFEQAILKEPDHKARNFDFMWQFKDLGFYSEQYAAYRENFSSVLCILYEDFQEKPEEVISNICRFLGVKDIPVDTSFRYNESGQLKETLMVKLLFRKSAFKSLLRPFLKTMRALLPIHVIKKIKYSLMKKHLEQKPELPESSKRALYEEYSEDIARLEQMLGRDLSAWKYE